jgi:hypothetical protein
MTSNKLKYAPAMTIPNHHICPVTAVGVDKVPAWSIYPPNRAAHPTAAQSPTDGVVEVNVAEVAGKQQASVRSASRRSVAGPVAKPASPASHHGHHGSVAASDRQNPRQEQVPFHACALTDPLAAVREAFSFFLSRASPLQLVASVPLRVRIQDGLLR